MKSGLEGLKLVQQIGAISIEAFIRLQLGLIYESQGVKEKAIMEFEISVQIESQIGGYDLVSHQDYLEKASFLKSD